MGSSSKIGWTDATWNCVVGCEHAGSPGCDRCYAARDSAGRLKNNPTYAGLAVKAGPGQPAVFTGEVRLLPERLYLPLTWREPRMVFVNSMSDCFHPKVPDGWIMAMWRVMGMAGAHTYQVLTKRPQRMKTWAARFGDIWDDYKADGPDGFPPLPHGPGEVRAAYPESPRAQLFADMLDELGPPPPGCAYEPYDWQEGMRRWPDVLPNVWLGTSIEGGSDLSAVRSNVMRVRHLSETKAALRFISLEPCLGPPVGLDLTNIGWVIVGGESGPGARRMDPEWAAEAIAKCRAAGVPVFFKQAGAVLAKEWGMTGAGADHAQMPAEFRTQEWPHA